MSSVLVLGIAPGTTQISPGMNRSRDTDKSGFFLPSALVLTDDGPVPAEWLRAGDRVLTRDKGFQPVLWVSRTPLLTQDCIGPNSSCPLEVRTAALRSEHPDPAIVVHPELRLLLRDPEAELYFGTSEVLCPAKAFVACGLAKPIEPSRDLSLCQIYLDEHEVIFVDDIWCESTRLSSGNLKRMGATERMILQDKLGETGIFQSAVRKVLDIDEAQLLMKPPEQAAKLQELSA